MFQRAAFFDETLYDAQESADREHPDAGSIPAPESNRHERPRPMLDCPVQVSQPGHQSGHRPIRQCRTINDLLTCWWSR